MEWVSALASPGPVAESADCVVWNARWEVLDGVNGEGLVVRPKQPRTGLVIVLPDADQTPEMWLGLAPGKSVAPGLVTRLAAAGVEVVILATVSRSNRYSGDEAAGVYTNQPHREWIYRQAAPVGRHIIGYEVQKVSAAIDALAPDSLASAEAGAALPVGVIGYGEGGLVAFYCAALDGRIRAAGVSGYFQPREQLWSEPIYRDVKNLLKEFGDAEVASLIAPRALIVEASDGPRVSPPGERAGSAGSARGRNSASAGALEPAARAAVQAEWARALSLAGATMAARFDWVVPDGGGSLPGSPALLTRLARRLGLTLTDAPPAELLVRTQADPREIEARQQRAVRELTEHVQAVARLSDRTREAFFWNTVKANTPAEWRAGTQALRRSFAEEFIGRLTVPSTSPRGRAAPVAALSTGAYTTYQVQYDVLPGVDDWGLLLIPAGLKTGERRPVVICQHGANSDPADLVEDEKTDKRGFGIYRAYAARLAAEGFVVFAPSMPHSSGGEPFRQLQRKATPLGQSIFSLVIASQTRLLQWLKAQPFVDPSRIAYYGMSYGGKAAMRVPVVIEDIAAVVVSGDFNDYVQKMTSTRSDRAGALFNASPDMIEFDLASTFNHAEMSALIAPRFFMVEHGYQDRVSPLEWLAAEYAKTQRLYLRLGIPERTAVFHFDGPHTVLGTESFAFLHRALRWPPPVDSAAGH